MSDASDFSDEDIPLSASKHITRASGQPPEDHDGDYKMTGALKVPRATSYTTQSLYGMHIDARRAGLFLRFSPDQIVSNDIELCPDYQRGEWPSTPVASTSYVDDCPDVVWPELKQIGNNPAYCIPVGDAK